MEIYLLYTSPRTLSKIKNVAFHPLNPNVSGRLATIKQLSVVKNKLVVTDVDSQRTEINLSSKKASDLKVCAWEFCQACKSSIDSFFGSVRRKKVEVAFTNCNCHPKIKIYKERKLISTSPYDGPQMCTRIFNDNRLVFLNDRNNLTHLAWKDLLKHQTPILHNVKLKGYHGGNSDSFSDYCFGEKENLAVLISQKGQGTKFVSGVYFEEELNKQAILCKPEYEFDTIRLLHNGILLLAGSLNNKNFATAFIKKNFEKPIYQSHSLEDPLKEPRKKFIVDTKKVNKGLSLIFASNKYLLHIYSIKNVRVKFMYSTKLDSSLQISNYCFHPYRQVFFFAVKRYIWEVRVKFN